MPDKPEQSTQGATKRTSLSIDEATSRLAKVRQSAAEAPQDDAGAEAAPTAEQQPDGLDPEVTNPSGESDAGGDDDAALAADAEQVQDGDSDAKDPVYRVKVDGEEYEVALSELMRSYSFEASQRQKSQALAEQRRAVESQAEQINARSSALSAKEQELEAERSRYDTALSALQEVFDQRAKAFADVDWRRLREEDPEKFQELRLEFELHKEEEAKLADEAKRREKERVKQAEERAKQTLETFQNNLAKRYPQWTDNAVMTKDWGDMYKVARKIGFNDDEFRSTRDDRIIDMLFMATELDRIKAAKASATKPAPTQAREPAKVVQPAGARPVVRAGANSGLNQAWAQLAKPGSDKIAAAEQVLLARKQAAASTARR